MRCLLQVANGFGDIDEVVGNTFGVLGKGYIFRTGLGFADTQSEALDMIALHLVGQMVEERKKHGHHPASEKKAW